MLGVRLNEQLDEQLTQLAQKTQRSKSYLTKEALKSYIKREEEKEQENQLALKRWNQYQQTGEYIAHEEVASWLRSWGTDQEHQWPLK